MTHETTQLEGVAVVATACAVESVSVLPKPTLTTVCVPLQGQRAEVAPNPGASAISARSPREARSRPGLHVPY